MNGFSLMLLNLRATTLPPPCKAQKHCEWCHQLFTPKQFKSVVCSPKCREDRKYAKRKAEGKV